GSHGELAGVLLTRAYHEDRGEQRHKVLAPDTAHGTNPATVTMAGLELVKLATDAAGGVDMDDLRAKADADVACLMLTNPNTLGLFDQNIEEIAHIVHGVGASLGADCLRDASDEALLNANYLLARLRRRGVAEYLPVAYGTLCMHEFVLSGAPMKRALQIKTLDLAKRLLDFGFHPPTVYFPLL